MALLHPRRICARPGLGLVQPSNPMLLAAAYHSFTCIAYYKPLTPAPMLPVDGVGTLHNLRLRRHRLPHDVIIEDRHNLSWTGRSSHQHLSLVAQKHVARTLGAQTLGDLRQGGA